MKIIGLLLISAIFLVQGLQAQSDTTRLRQWLIKNERFKPDFKTMVQLWSLYSTGMEVYNKDTKQYEPVDDRFNLMLRRARLVVAGEPYNNLKYTVAFSYDQIGRGILSSDIDGANTATPSVGI